MAASPLTREKPHTEAGVGGRLASGGVEVGGHPVVGGVGLSTENGCRLSAGSGRKVGWWQREEEEEKKKEELRSFPREGGRR